MSLSNANLKYFSLPRSFSFFWFFRFYFQLLTVRRPCCISRTYIAAILNFLFSSICCIRFSVFCLPTSNTCNSLVHFMAWYAIDLKAFFLRGVLFQQWDHSAVLTFLTALLKCFYIFTYFLDHCKIRNFRCVVVFQFMLFFSSSNFSGVFQSTLASRIYANFSEPSCNETHAVDDMPWLRAMYIHFTRRSLYAVQHYFQVPDVE